MNKEQIAKLKELHAAFVRGAGNGTRPIVEWHEAIIKAGPELIALAEKQQIAEDAAKAIIAAIGDMPEVERTTSPVSQMTDEMRSAFMFNAELSESHGFINQAKHLRDILAAAAPHAQAVELSKDQIREIFLANGFTIKEGQTDLKPYVYAAACALLAAAPAAPVAEQGEPEAYKLARILWGMVEAVEDYDGPEIYRDGYSSVDGDVFVHRAGHLLVEQAAEVAELRRYVDAFGAQLAAIQQPQEPDFKSMVDRFLGWKLPKDFHPDCYISFDREGASNHSLSWPIGTNLLTADQAEAMFRYCLGEGAK